MFNKKKTLVADVGKKRKLDEIEEDEFQMIMPPKQAKKVRYVKTGKTTELAVDDFHENYNKHITDRKNKKLCKNLNLIFGFVYSFGRTW